MQLCIYLFIYFSRKAVLELSIYQAALELRSACLCFLSVCVRRGLNFCCCLEVREPLGLIALVNVGLAYTIYVNSESTF